MIWVFHFIIRAGRFFTLLYFLSIILFSGVYFSCFFPQSEFEHNVAMPCQQLDAARCRCLPPTSATITHFPLSLSLISSTATAAAVSPLRSCACSSLSVHVRRRSEARQQSNTATASTTGLVPLRAAISPAHGSDNDCHHHSRRSMARSPPLCPRVAPVISHTQPHFVARRRRPSAVLHRRRRHWRGAGRGRV